jgi:hypothetical protein
VLEVLEVVEPEELVWWWSLNTFQHMTARTQKTPMLGLLGTAPCNSANCHQDSHLHCCNEAQGKYLEQAPWSPLQEWTSC